MTPYEEWVARTMMGRGWPESEVLGVLGVPFTSGGGARRRYADVSPDAAKRIERMWSYGFGVIPIARTLHISEGSVCRYVEAHPDVCERRKPGRRRVEFDLDRAVTLRRQGRTYDDVAKEVGVSRSTVISRLHEVGM